jgi:dihydroorotate dehydrogenase (fumarate)
MGMELKNPLVPSASPLPEKVENVKKMEDAGASAVVMFSIFEEQFRHEMDELEYHVEEQGAESFPEALSYHPQLDEYRVSTDRYLEIIQKASEAVDIPIIGSLNGTSSSGWIEFAKKIEQAGAKGLELNLYFLATDPTKTGAEIDQMCVNIVKGVKSSIDIPVAVKLSPFFSSTANIAKQLDDAGASALVLFNRFYQPDIDIENRKIARTLSLSNPWEMRLPLRWIGILHGQVNASLAATTGVHSATEIVKYLMAGADVTMSTSALLKNGIGHITTMLKDLEQWLDAHEYGSVEEIKGSMDQGSVSDPAAFERANYIKILEKYKMEYSL